MVKAAGSGFCALRLPHRYSSCRKDVNLVKDLLCFLEQSWPLRVQQRSSAEESGFLSAAEEVYGSHMQLLLTVVLGPNYYSATLA